MTKNTNSEKEVNHLSNQPNDSRLAAVRDLLFGENIQQYEINFDEVYEKITTLKNDSDTNLADAVSSIEGKIEALQKSMENSIEKLTADMDNKISKLDDAKADRKKIGKALEKIAIMLQA